MLGVQIDVYFYTTIPLVAKSIHPSTAAVKQKIHFDTSINRKCIATFHNIFLFSTLVQPHMIQFLNNSTSLEYHQNLIRFATSTPFQR